jgi:DNA-binding transcriptional regulator YiaG
MAKVARGTYQFKESGLRYVYLKGIELVRCPSCGTIDPIIPHMNELMRVLVLAVIARPFRLGGAEIRFLRKFLGKTGEEFASILSVDKTTLSKWENNDDPVGEQSDRLIRTVTLGLDDSLKERLQEIINSFPQISEQSHDDQIKIDPAKMSYEYA